MKIFFVFFLRSYQILVSPFVSSSCRFYPTCSEYFLCVIIKYNFFIFLFFFLRRVLRCNAFFKGGYDPSP